MASTILPSKESLIGACKDEKVILLLERLYNATSVQMEETLIKYYHTSYQSKYSIPDMQKTWLEFLRFMVLKALMSDLDAKILSPTPLIDEVWHLTILFPKIYQKI